MKSDNSQTAFDPGFGHRRRGRRAPFPPAFAAGRPGFGGGFGPFGGPFGTRGRARRGDVRLAVLSLLAEAPNNGYGLIKAIAEKTDDSWRASPGSVYPTLSQLVDEKLANADGGDYTLTDTGHAYVTEHAEQLAAVWQVGATVSGEQAALIHATRKLLGAIRQLGTDGSADKQAAAAQKVDALRKELYRLLGE